MSAEQVIPRLAITAGEPAGIGPDILLSAATQPHDAQLVAIGSEAVLAERAKQLGLNVALAPYSSTDAVMPHVPGTLPLIDILAPAAVTPGTPHPDNARHVLALLDQAVSLCKARECAAMVTAPLHKGVINDAGIPFSGHTEYLRDATGADHVVMLLTSGSLRVALATTHLPLSRVPAAITSEHLSTALTVLNHDLRSKFGIAKPRITVLGLNPHAGEGGHLGTEERDVIEPVCSALRDQGLQIKGPVPADSAFIPAMRSDTDAYLAMYHDQGLPVLKADGFEGAVNISLGLPIIRTSVDHGTALTLAGTGKASAGSLLAAIRAAEELALAGQK